MSCDCTCDSHVIFILEETMHMNVPLSFVLIFLTSQVFGQVANAPPGQTLGQPWPMPQSYVAYPDLQLLSSASFNFNPTGKNCDILQEAIRRYRLIIFGPSNALKFRPQSNINVMKSLDVNLLNDCENYPSLDMKENCKNKTRPILIKLKIKILIILS